MQSDEQKFSNLRPLLSITFPQGFRKSKKFGHWTLRSEGKKTFKQGEQIKTICKKNFFCGGNLTHIMIKSFQIKDHFFSLLFPKDSKILNSFDIGLWEVGTKRPLNGVRKCDRKTDRKTYGHFDL